MLSFRQGSVVLTWSALAGCTGPLSTLDPAGPAAGQIAVLWWVMLAGAAAIFALVMGLVLAAFRHRAKVAVDPAQERRVWIYRLGLVFPSVVLSGLLAYGVMLGAALMPRDGPQVVTVRAEARQWQWRFGYDGSSHETRNVLHIPAGRPVDVQITSVDVIHSFWVPRLAGKLDAIPGRVNVLRIEAPEAGEFAGVSAEFSGEGYADHGFSVIAHDAAGWQAFLRDGVLP